VSSQTASVETGRIETNIPARLDRLPWARFHWMVVLGLGTVWILDGLEVTIVGAIAPRLTEPGSGIAITTAQIGTAAAVYVAGACTGALFFGQLTDRFGRKKLFLLTLGVYILATLATAASWTAWFFFLCRFLTGAGIGGEYAAINSAIDELIPARVRGRVDLIINGSYWAGSAAGSAIAILLLDKALLSANVGWRLAFLLGAVIGLGVLFVRRTVPESPRWLFIHGREEEAEAIVRDIEKSVEREMGEDLEEPERKITVRQRERIPFREIAKTAFQRYPRRAILGLALFIGQAFLYNGVTFNLGVLYTTFWNVSSSFVPVFLIVFAVGNFLGPLLLGRLFDTVGRKPMIAGTYLGSAAIAVLLALLFTHQSLGGSPWTFQAFIFGIFFLASAGASAAYLTVSEIFPMETRALAIAFFFAVGTGIGGIIGPLLFGNLIASGNRGEVATAFLIGAGVMAVGGIVELIFGVKAEQVPLENIAKPLTAEEAERTPEREREGRRRYRPGPGLEYPYYSPGFLGTSLRRPTAVAELQHEVEAIGRAVDEGGPISREELYRMVGGRRWGPGRFRRALGEAVASGRIRRAGRDRFGPPEPGA
jgi:MFS family permease